MNRFKLSLMMFLQFMMYAVWWVPLAAYLTNMEVGSFQKSLIISSMAIGCLLSPVVGMLADRFFPGQKVLAVLNLINAVMLFLAGTTNNPDILFICLLIAMLGYMPSWGLTSTIAMTHIPSQQFPRVRVFGSVGWVASGLFSIVFIHVFKLDFDGTNIPFYCGAAVSLIAVFTNLGLPNTPPLAKGQKVSMVDIFGLRAIELLKDRNYKLFMIMSLLSIIPFAMYYSYFSQFLQEIEISYISITMNWGILAEMGFMLLMPIAISKLGLRKVMILGLIALSVRYLAFYIGGVTDQLWMFYIGILVHGLIFGFFYISGQIYTDKIAPAHLKGQSQGFLFLVTYGIGLFAGNIICGKIINHFDWDMTWKIMAISSIVLLIAFSILIKNDDNLAKEEAG
jgi:nucleoside transporter